MILDIGQKAKITYYCQSKHELFVQRMRNANLKTDVATDTRTATAVWPKSSVHDYKELIRMG